MKRSTLLTVSALALIAAIGAGIAVTAKRPGTDFARGEKLFANLGSKLDSAASIEITRHDGRFTLVRKGETWVLPEKGDFPVRPELIRQTLAALTEMETIEAKTAKPELFERLNLNDPADKDAKSIRVAVKDGSGGILADLLIGKRRPGTATAAGSTGDSQMLYVRKAGENNTWLVQAQIDARASAVDWTSRDLMDITMEDLSKVELTGADGAVLTLSRAPDVKDFTVENVPEGRKAKSGWDVNQLGTTLETLNFEDVQMADTVSAPVNAAKGRFESKDGLIVTITLVPNDKDTWALIKAEGNAEKAAPIATKVDGWAFRLPDYKRERLLKTINDVLQPVEPAPAGG
ncbi:DUF4340 domain-containing protein [Lacibacterium aquatile]|uniref:DUF4340 domain-containing protein n=1 Tax=Lacibacterium aquatile TaxID=1168082 RepID=A0ABW5DPK3_9PROT